MRDNCAKQRRISYISCRKQAAEWIDALGSRAGAAELLNVSESSLRDYETGMTTVPADVVVRMADLYNAPELQVLYCKNDCPIGKYVCRTVSDEVKNIETITCSLLYHISELKVQDAIKTLLRIASDGKVSDSEKSDLGFIVQILENASSDVSDLRLLLEKEGNMDGIEGKIGEHSSR